MTDLQDALAAAGVHTLIAQFTDLHGAARGLLVPLRQLERLLAEGVAFPGSSIAGSGLPRTGARSEYFARGHAESLRALPWMPGYAHILCDGFVAGDPFDACPRQVLRRQVDRLLARHEWTMQVGLAPDFHLLRRADGRWTAADAAEAADPSGADGHILRALPRQRGFLDPLCAALSASGLELQQTKLKGAGQYGLQFGPAEALLAADQLMLFKLAAQSIAEPQGLAFSMMPKPFADRPGNGLRIQVSLWDGADEDARNLFADAEEALSPLAGHFVAGVLAHGAALCALGAPTVNSYKRLAGGYPASADETPAALFHGADNGSALLRTRPGRIEWQLPDASANPYLAIAGLIAAGLDGVQRRLAPPPAVEFDPFERRPGARPGPEIVRLPRSLDEAVAALERDKVLCDALGPTLAAEFPRLKRLEAAEYARQVSEWELQRYAQAF